MKQTNPEYEIMTEAWKILKSHAFARTMYDADNLCSDLYRLSEMGNDKKQKALSCGLAQAVLNYFQEVSANA